MAKKEIPERKARQGPKHRMNLLIFIAAMLLAALAWLIADIYGSAVTDEAPDEPPVATDGQVAPTADEEGEAAQPQQ